MFNELKIKEVLMERDGLTYLEADELIQDCREDLEERLALGELPEDIMSEWFNLEPDFIFDLLFG